eukprot:PhF_6_TR34156/c0_g1_i1/m.49910/K01539/ATP1A; sodium/potassium-transporting ATPase subunit alpha
MSDLSVSLQSRPSLLGHKEVKNVDRAVAAEYMSSLQQHNTSSSSIGINMNSMCDPSASTYYKDIHLLSTEEIEGQLNTRERTGLTSREALRRFSIEGANVIPTSPEQTPEAAQLLYQVIFSAPSCTLWPAALLLILIWKLYDKGEPSSAYFVSWLLLSLMAIFQGTFSYLRRRRSFIQSSPLWSENEVYPVFRDGVEKDIRKKALVAGDVIRLEVGDCCPADVRIIQIRQQVQFRKRFFTGEDGVVTGTVSATGSSLLESRNIILAGCVLTKGSCVGVIFATGSRTQMGLMMLKVGRGTTSAIDRDLNRYLYGLAVLAAILAVLVVVVGLSWLHPEHPTFLPFDALILDIVSAFLAPVPQGIHVAVSLALFFACHQLQGNNTVIVTKLQTIEALGSVGIVCIDMAGMVTQNYLRLVRITRGLSKVYSAPFLDEILPEIHPITLACKLTSEGPSASPLDAALHDWTFDKSANDFTTEHISSYSTKTKFGMVIAQNSERKKFMFCKGAPETILSFCSTYLDDNGAEITITSDAQQAIITRQRRLGEMGMIVVALCDRELDADVEFVTHCVPNQARFLGMVALQDPSKQDVEETIGKLQESGIRVMMFTPEHPTTASAVAREVGIFHDPTATGRRDSLLQSVVSPGALIQRAAVLTGNDIEQLETEKLEFCLRHTEIVFARTSAEHKVRVVKLLQSMGWGVAITGSTVQDSPALKAADVGVGFLNAAETTKEVAGLLLETQDFSALYESLFYGRLLFENLQKIVVFMLPTGSVVKIIVVLAKLFLGMPIATSPYLMMVQSVLVDPLAAVGLVFESAESGMMHTGPRDREYDGVISWRIVRHSLFVGVIEAICAYGLWFAFLNSKGAKIGDVVLGFIPPEDPDTKLIFQSAQCLFFIVVVSCQLGNLFATRTRRAPVIFQSFNWKVMVSGILSFGVAVLCVRLPQVHEQFQTHGFEVEYWGYAIACGLVTMFLIEIKKYIAVRWGLSGAW